MKAALALLAEDPDINTADAAAKLDITRDYARTLLRRARNRVAHPAAPEIQPSRSEQDADLRALIQQLSSRLCEAERLLDSLRFVPPASRTGWGSNRRTQVLQLAAAGKDPAAISSELGLPSGEVEFIIKVDRLSSAVL